MEEITVTSSVGRLYGRGEAEEIEVLNGFQLERSCIADIFTIRYFVEKKLAKGKKLHVIFVDLQKALDAVPFQKYRQP